MMVVNTSPLSLLRVSTATNEQRLTFLRSTAEADTLLLPRAYRHGSWLMAHGSCTSPPLLCESGMFVRQHPTPNHQPQPTPFQSRSS